MEPHPLAAPCSLFPLLGLPQGLLELQRSLLGFHFTAWAQLISHPGAVALDTLLPQQLRKAFSELPRPPGQAFVDN